MKEGGAFYENLMEQSVKLHIYPAAASDVTCKYSTEYDDLKNVTLESYCRLKIRDRNGCKGGCSDFNFHVTTL